MDRIVMGHGSGGKLMHELIETVLAPAFGIRKLQDSAILDALEIPKGARLAYTTDSYVVSPLFFPGGNIGTLAVNGTVNDLAVSGARPLYLTVGMIIEEGMQIATLKRIVRGMVEAAGRSGVKIVAGDTKVVDKGKGDGIFINTSGIGIIPKGVELGPERIQPGDKILLSGPSGTHGVSVMAERNGLMFEPPIESDSAPLNALAEAMLANPKKVRVMRDPTRGGIATTLKELAMASGLCLRVYENDIQALPGVRGACDLLGLDHLYVANEGTLIAIVAADAVSDILEAMRQVETGEDAALIGEVLEGPKAEAVLRTSVGGERALHLLPGEQLPRIC